MAASVRSLTAVVDEVRPARQAHYDGYIVLLVEGVQEVEVGLALLRMLIGRYPVVGDRFTLRLEPLVEVQVE